MSWQAMDAVDQLEYGLCGALAYRVLVKLANVAAQDGSRAFRSKTDMATELGVSERSIQRALRELEGLHLIRPGDQRHVSHLPANRRPTVYDINMHHPGTVAQPVLSGDTTGETSGETSGETQLLTGLLATGSGETTGETTAVRHKELIELTTKTSKGNQTGAVSPCGHPRIPEAPRYCLYGCPPMAVAG